MKQCNKCSIEKPLSEFSKCSRLKDGLQAYCKQCVKETNARWNNNNKLRIKQYDKYYKHQCKLPYWIVYQLPNANNYIGQTNQPQLRMNNHKLNGRNSDNWIELHRCNTLQEALTIEAQYHSLGYPGENTSYNRNKTLLETLKTTI